jgi:hypothetical protein
MDRRSFSVCLGLTALTCLNGDALALAIAPAVPSKVRWVGALVNTEWNKLEIMSPSAYLKTRINHQVSFAIALENCVKDDTRNKQYFYVNGLQLSKTEAALLATLV